MIQNSVAINDQKPIEIEPGDLIITKEEQVNHFNQNTIKTLTIAEQNNRTVASLGVYSANENSWVANPQPLRLDNNTVSQYEFQEKLVDKTKSGVFVSEDKPFDPSQYLAMLVVFFFIAELLFMKTNVTNKVLIK